MSTLGDWLADATATLNLPPDSIPESTSESMTVELRDDLLDLTRDVAHGIARVAGPLTTYLVGVAVGRGMSPTAAISSVSDLVAQRTAGSDSDADLDTDADTTTTNDT